MDRRGRRGDVSGWFVVNAGDKARLAGAIGIGVLAFVYNSTHNYRVGGRNALGRWLAGVGLEDVLLVTEAASALLVVFVALLLVKERVSGE